MADRTVEMSATSNNSRRTLLAVYIALIVSVAHKCDKCCVENLKVQMKGIRIYDQKLCILDERKESLEPKTESSMLVTHFRGMGGSFCLKGCELSSANGTYFLGSHAYTVFRELKIHQLVNFLGLIHASSDQDMRVMQIEPNVVSMCIA